MPPKTKQEVDVIIARYNKEANIQRSTEELKDVSQKNAPKKPENVPQEPENVPQEPENSPQKQENVPKKQKEEDPVTLEMADQTQQDLKDIREYQFEEYRSTKPNFQIRDAERDKGDTNMLTDKVLLQMFSGGILKSAYQNERFNFTPQEQIDYFKNLAAEDQDTVDDPLPPEEDPLKRILQETEYYGRLKMTANIAKNEHYDDTSRLAEGRLARRIYRHLNDLFDQMNRQNDEANRKSLAENTMGGGRTDEFASDERMFAVSNLLNYFEGEMFGKLGSVPEQPEHPDAIHMTCVGKYRGVKDLEAAVLNQATEHPDDVDLDHDLVKDYRNQPLFPHEPCPQDIQQYGIGDCYFLATLGEIAAHRPEKIKEMIRDNNDGTATVRFYHRTQKGPNGFEPFYVTVDKVASQGQATGSVWVQTMERALAASGMAAVDRTLRSRGIESGTSDEPSRNPHPTPLDPGDFSGIEGASTLFAQQLMLGNDAQGEQYIIGGGTGPLKDEEIKPIDLAGKNSRDAAKCLGMITTAFTNGDLVNAGALASDKAGDHIAPCGINKKHAYTVMGIESKVIQGQDGKEYTRYFVKLRNPHGRSGRDYRVVGNKLEAFSTEGLTAKDKGKGIFGIAGDNNGIAYVEINHFVKEFADISIAHMKPSSLEKTDRIANDEIQRMRSYHEAIQEIDDHLDQGIFALSHNSKEYKRMKEAMHEAAKHPAKNYKDLIDQLVTIKAAVDRYQEHAAQIEGNPKRRAVKAEACSAFNKIMEAAYQHFEHPKNYVRTQLADRMIDNFLSQDQTGHDPQGVQKIKDRIAKDRKGFRDAVQRTPHFIEQVPRDETSIVTMTSFLDKGKAFRKVKPADLDLSQKKPEHKTARNLVDAVTKKAKPAADKKQRKPSI